MESYRSLKRRLRNNRSRNSCWVSKLACWSGSPSSTLRTLTLKTCRCQRISEFFRHSPITWSSSYPSSWTTLWTIASSRWHKGTRYVCWINHRSQLPRQTNTRTIGVDLAHLKATFHPNWSRLTTPLKPPFHRLLPKLPLCPKDQP